MPLKESPYSQDWFTKARQDVRTVEILLQADGLYFSDASHFP